MGITIGSASGAYGNEGIDAGKINPSEEDAERIAEERREALEEQGIDPAGVEGAMTGTLETSDPNNPEDADDVTPSKEDPSVPEGDLDEDENQVPPGTTVNEDGQIVVNENADPGPDPEANPAEAYDPGDHSVGEVEEYLKTASDEEKARVIEAEQNGKQRKGILALG